SLQLIVGLHFAKLTASLGLQWSLSPRPPNPPLSLAPPFPLPPASSSSASSSVFRIGLQSSHDSSSAEFSVGRVMVRELLAVLVRAALQWALATLLLANGAAFCLIAAAASSLRLGPPCLLCARVHRLLCSDCGQEERDAFRRLLCDAHVAAIARLGAQEAEQPACSPSDHVDAGTKYGG
uniref:Uncharacterized protein n=1 Tax=Aegilops tauschii subsp. strangulata TaxID=200361 RepID=A0A453DWZ5_AEGTS